MASFKTAAALQIRPANMPESAEVCGTTIDISWPDAGAALAANNIVQLVELPPGVSVIDYTLATDDVDDGAGLVLSFGELNAAGDDVAVVYASGITTGQAGGLYRAAGIGHLFKDKSARRMLGLKVTTAAATPNLTGKKAVLNLQLRG